MSTILFTCCTGIFSAKTALMSVEEDAGAVCKPATRPMEVQAAPRAAGLDQAVKAAAYGART
jgi:hypothetical protein